MDLGTFDWLLTEDGGRLLDVAAEALAAAEGDPVRAAELVRRRGDATPDRRAAALSQVTLRVRAAAKLGPDAGRMFFTPEALEQATRAPVAAHRAARLAAAEVGSVVDLGCGIGGDLMALARAGLTAAGVDTDPVRVAVARANLAALGLPGAVTVADATRVDVAAFGASFCDPARRGGRGRVFDAEGWTPPWSFVERLLAGVACVKTAPGLPHDLVPDGVEAEWVSDHGEVKEAALWSRPLATTPRRATVIGDGGLATLTGEDAPDGEPETGPAGAFLYEPDGAVIRAGLVTAVAAGVGGRLLDRRVAYVTSDAAYRTPFARSYRVLEELPYREKPLRAALRERGIGRLTIKKRGVAAEPEVLRRRLALRGDGEATLVLARVGTGARAFLVEPL
jgi:SAM-dependent methyltransferase